MQKTLGRFVKLFMVMIVACCIMAFGTDAASVKAEESNQATVAEAQAADSDTAEDDGSGVMLLLGGMLILILAVVVTVVATVVVTIPAAADEV